MRKITNARIVTAKPIIAYVSADVADASFLGSPPEVTNLMPAKTIKKTLDAAATLVKIRMINVASAPKSAKRPAGGKMVLVISKA